MTFEEFWTGTQLEGKTINSLEAKLACHLAWENAKVAERCRCAKIIDDMPQYSGELGRYTTMDRKVISAAIQTGS